MSEATENNEEVLEEQLDTEPDSKTLSAADKLLASNVIRNEVMELSKAITKETAVKALAQISRELSKLPSVVFESDEHDSFANFFLPKSIWEDLKQKSYVKALNREKQAKNKPLNFTAMVWNLTPSLRSTWARTSSFCVNFAYDEFASDKNIASPNPHDLAQATQSFIKALEADFDLKVYIEQALGSKLPTASPVSNYGIVLKILTDDWDLWNHMQKDEKWSKYLG